MADQRSQQLFALEQTYGGHLDVRDYAWKAGLLPDTIGTMRFDQVKIAARDAGSLASFYEQALGCHLISPVAEFDDETLARGFGAPGARIRMAWLRLPGSGDEEPILELYELVDDLTWGYSPGQGHLTFQVEDVATVADQLVAAGGSYLGELVDWKTPSGNMATFVLMRDPEGNIVDLWAPHL